jgi:hypothetical protein
LEGEDFGTSFELGGVLDALAAADFSGAAVAGGAVIAANVPTSSFSSSGAPEF